MTKVVSYLTPSQFDWYTAVMRDGSFSLTLDGSDSKTAARIPAGVVGQPATVRIGFTSASLATVRFYPLKFWDIPKESVAIDEHKTELPPLVSPPLFPLLRS